MRLRQSATLGLVASLAFVQAFGQLHADAELVLINASVADRDGWFVTGLDATQFQVFDEKRPVAIRAFSIANAPVATVVLLDTRASRKPNIACAQAQLIRNLSTATPGDEFCLITFAKNVSSPCGFTTETELFQHAAAMVVPEGRTTFVDGLMRGLNEVKKGRNFRKAQFILSDGVDTDSRDPAILDELDIRRQYLIGVTPSGPARDGKYRRVNIQLNGIAKTNMRVHWGRGYYASGESYGRS